MVSLPQPQTRVYEEFVNLETGEIMKGESICNLERGVFETERNVLECSDLKRFKVRW